MLSQNISFYENKQLFAILGFALSVIAFGCQKEPVIHPNPAQDHEEHHNILVGHTWQMEQDTFISGLHFIVKAKLTFLNHEIIPCLDITEE